MDSDTSQFHRFPVLVLAPYKLGAAKLCEKMKIAHEFHKRTAFDVFCRFVKRFHATDANWTEIFCSCLWFHFWQIQLVWLNKTKLKAFTPVRYHLDYMPDAVRYYRSSLFTVRVMAQLSACAEFPLNWIRIYSTYDFNSSSLFLFLF